jgi:hypothetical protein
MDSSRPKNSPWWKKKPKKKATEEATLAKIFFEKPSVDWGHGPGSLRIDQLVCTPVVDLLDGVRSFPLWLELPLRLVRDDDGAPKNENQLALPEDALLDELVVSSHHVPAIKLQVLQGMKTLLFKGVKLLEVQLYLFIFGELVPDGHP